MPINPADIEPRTCYYTGQGHCGDCRDVETSAPLGCFDAECQQCWDTGWIAEYEPPRFDGTHRPCPDCEHQR